MLVPLKVRQFSDMQRWSMWKADGARPLWRRLLQAAEVRKHCATGLNQVFIGGRHGPEQHGLPGLNLLRRILRRVLANKELQQPLRSCCALLRVIQLDGRQQAGRGGTLHLHSGPANLEPPYEYAVRAGVLDRARGVTAPRSPLCVCKAPYQFLLPV